MKLKASYERHRSLAKRCFPVVIVTSDYSAGDKSLTHREATQMSIGSGTRYKPVKMSRTERPSSTIVEGSNLRQTRQTYTRVL